MSPARPSHQTDAVRPLRAERRTAGLVAQYIHEISDRHAGAHAAAPADSPDPLNRREPAHEAEPS